MVSSLKVYDYLNDKLKDGAIHLTLIDPEEQKSDKAGIIAQAADEGSTDGILLGGSIGILQEDLDRTILAIKERTDLPTILFPGDVSGISRHADAILFMSLLNSRNPYFITGAQMAGAPSVKKLGIEVISMGYLIVEPGGMAGYVGEARLIPRAKPEIAVAYALAAEFLGMKMVYLEGGSGIKEPIPAEMVRAVKSHVSIPVIVGGGIRSGKEAADMAHAGADIIITGTVVEDSDDVAKKIKEITKAIKSN